MQGKRRWKPCRFGTRLQRFRNRARAEHRVPARTVGQQFQIVVIMHAHLWSCATHASCISNQCSKQNFGALCYVHTRAAPQSLQAQHLLYTRCTQLWASVFLVEEEKKSICYSLLPAHGGKQQVLSTSRILASCTRRDVCYYTHLNYLSTMTSTTRLHRLYINLAVCRDYSVRRCSACCPVALALLQIHRASRLLAPGRIGSTSIVSFAATTCLPVATVLPQPRRASGCLGSSRGSSSTTSPRVGSSLTTPPTPRVRVPRHVARLLTRLVAPLIVDYFAYAARPGASARSVAHLAARRRLLRLRRASGFLSTSRGSSRGSSSTTPCAATSSCGHTGSTSATPCVVTTCLAATLALLRVRRAPPRRRLPIASR
jgi:hypothetical protein